MLCEQRYWEIGVGAGVAAGATVHASRVVRTGFCRSISELHRKAIDVGQASTVSSRRDNALPSVPYVRHLAVKLVLHARDHQCI